LPGKTRLRNDPLCVQWDVKPYTPTLQSTSKDCVDDDDDDDDDNDNDRQQA